MKDFFNLFNRFLAEAWPARLTKAECIVWLAMLGHADENFEAWPGSRLLASYIGHKHSAHARSVRASLASKGLLVGINTAGGDNRATARYRVCLPSGAGALKSERVPKSGRVPKSEQRRSNPSAPGVSELSAPGALNSDTRKEQGTEQREGHEKGDAPGAGGVVFPSGLQASAELREVFSKWVALFPGKMPMSRQQANVKRLEGLSLADAIQATNDALAGAHTRIYTDRIKSTKRGKHEFSEPNTASRIRGYKPAGPTD